MAAKTPAWVWLALAGGLAVLAAGGVAVALWAIPDRGKPYAPLFAAAEAANGLPQNLLARMAKEESDYDPGAVSSVGAQGMMQFMPATASDVGLADPFDPAQAIPKAGQYMRQLFNQLQNALGSATWSMAIAAYNAGPGNVIRAVQSAVDAQDLSNWLAYLPTSAANQAQTDNYTTDIAGDLGLAAYTVAVRQPIKRTGAKLAAYVSGVCQDLVLA